MTAAGARVQALESQLREIESLAKDDQVALATAVRAVRILWMLNELEDISLILGFWAGETLSDEAERAEGGLSS